MIRAIGATERFRVPVLHALYDLSDEDRMEILGDLTRAEAAADRKTPRATTGEPTGGPTGGTGTVPA